MSITPDRMEAVGPMAEPNPEIGEDLIKQNIRNHHQVMATEKLGWIKNEYSEFLRKNWHILGHVGVNRAFDIMGHPGINLESITVFINESGSRPEWSAFRFVLSPQDYNVLRPDFKKKTFSTESWSEEDLTKCGVPFVKTENGLIVDERFRTIESPKMNRSRNGKIFSNNVRERILGNGQPEIGIQSDTGQNLNGTVNQPKEEKTPTPDTVKQPVPTPEKRSGFINALRNRATKFTEFIAEHKPQMPQVSEFKPMSYEQNEKSAQYKMWSESDHNVGEILKPLSGVKRIREVKISIPNPVQPLSELFKEVTGHTIRGKAVGEYAKEIAIRGSLSALIGAGLGAAGVVGVPLAVISGAGVSAAMEARKQHKEHVRDFKRLAFSAGTGAAFGAVGGAVGLLGLSETGVGQAVKGALGMAGNVKDEAIKGVGDFVGEKTSGLGTIFSNSVPEMPVESITTSMPEISDLGVNVESTRPVIQPGSYSPAIEIPDNAHEWILDVNNSEGLYATAVQAEVGKNVGEVGKDLSYIEYGLQRGLEQRGLTMENMDKLTLDTNRFHLLHVLEDAANWAFDRHLQDAVRMNLSLDEMIDLGRDTFDEWLDIHGLDELAREVDLDLKQAA